MFDEDQRAAVTADATHVGCADGGWREIDRKLRRVAKRRAALEAEEADLMLQAMRSEVHVHLGYGSFTEYLQRACGYAPGTARDRVRVAEALESLPGTRQALAAGEISFSAVRELSRVMTPDTEDDWLTAVANCTVREIEDAVQGHEPGDHPDDRPDPALETRRVRLALTPDAYALFREARAALEHETGSPMTDAELMAMLCRRALSGGGKDSNTPPYTIAVTTCRDCKRGWQETGAQSIELSPATLERMRCDCTDLGDVDGAAPAKTTRAIPAPTRRAVLARDKHRCVVPGCTSSQFVDVHHITYRSNGGTNQMSNLAVFCQRHHHHIHDGLLRVEGTAGSLRFFHADGRPYGTAVAPSPAAAHVGRPSSPLSAVAADVHRALVTMGFTRTQATDAVKAATSHVERDTPFEPLLRAALKACPQPRAP